MGKSRRVAPQISLAACPFYALQTARTQQRPLISRQPTNPISLSTNHAAVKDRRSELHKLFWFRSKTGGTQKSKPCGVGLIKDISSGTVGSLQRSQAPTRDRFNSTT